MLSLGSRNKHIPLINYHHLILYSEDSQHVSRTPRGVRFLYLKAIKGSIVFKCQDVVRDWEDVAMGSDQTPKVDGFSC